MRPPVPLLRGRRASGLKSSPFSSRTVLGSFYKPEELGKRAVFFHTFAGVGTLASSALQATVHSTLNGRSGLSGWKWLMIVDAIITIPIAVVGYVFLPPLPGQKEANKATFWLSERVRPPALPLSRARSLVAFSPGH